MNQETLNQIEQATYDLDVIWSTLEAVYDAMRREDRVAETYMEQSAELLKRLF